MIYVWIIFIANGFVCWFFKGTNIMQSSPETISWLIVGICTMAYIPCIGNDINDRSEYKIFIFAYFFRLILLFWDREYSHIFSIPNSGLDSEMYQKVAVSMLEQSNVQRSGQYQYVLKNLYRVFGVQRVIGQYFNVLLGMTSIVYLVQILNKLNIQRKVKTATIILAGFLPNFAIMNAILLRETVMITLLAASLYYFVLWWQTNKNGYFIVATGLVLYSSTFHSGSIAPLLGYVICAILYDREKEAFRFNRNTIIMIFICVFAFAVINEQYGDKIFHRFNKVESIEEITEKAKTGMGGSGYEAGISTGNATADMVINTPIRMFYFVASPLPWKWRGLNDIIAFCFSAAFYGYCYFAAIKALRIKECKNKNLIIVFVIFALTSGFIFAWGVKNAGTALRHRDKFVIQYLVLFALCMENQNIRRLTYEEM